MRFEDYRLVGPDSHEVSYLMEEIILARRDSLTHNEDLFPGSGNNICVVCLCFFF